MHRFAPLLLLPLLAQEAPAETRTNVEYGVANGVSLRMDLHIPDGPGPYPAVILVHGGGWIRGDRERDLQPLFKPLENANFAWFSISYRLVNDIHSISSILFIDQAVSDVRRAISHIRENAEEYRIDRDRVALIGESAGAHLAAMAALKRGSLKPVQAVVAFYCPSDLVTLVENHPDMPDAVRDKIEGSGGMGMLLGFLGQLSPVNFVRKDMPPVLLIHGTADSLVPFTQSERFCERINEAGATCELIPVKGGGHGLRAWERGTLSAYKGQMIAWLQQQLSVSAARAN